MRTTPRACCRGWYGGSALRSYCAGWYAARSKPRSISMASLQLPALLLEHGRGERQVLAVSRHRLLALAAQDVADEFPDLRVDLRAGLAVDVEEGLADQRIAAVVHRLQRQRHVRPTVLRSDGQRLGLRRQVHHAAVADAVAVLVEVLHHLLRAGDQLAVGVGEVGEELDALVPLVAAHQDRVGDSQTLLVSQIEAVGIDLLVLPFAGEAELAPGANVLLGSADGVAVPLEVGAPAAFAGGAEDAVELRERQLRDRVVLVDEDAERVAPASDVVRAG